MAIFNSYVSLPEGTFSFHFLQLKFLSHPHFGAVHHPTEGPWSVVRTPWAAPPGRSIAVPRRRGSGPSSESSWRPGGGRGGHLFSDGDFTDFSGDFQAPQLAGKLSYCIHCLNPYFNRIYNAMAGQHPKYPNSQHPQNICWSIFECRENVHPWPPPSHPHPNTPILLDSRSFSQNMWSPPTPKRTIPPIEISSPIPPSPQPLTPNP